MNLPEFFHMGGYALYVWPAYAVTLGVLIGNALAARISHKRALEQARRRLQMQDRQAQERKV